MGLVHGVPKGGTVWEVPFARSALFLASYLQFLMVNNKKVTVTKLEFS